MKLTTPEISWHGKEPLFSLDFSLNNKSTRLATSGADSNIRIWAVLADEDKGSKVDFLANLSRHTKAVNVVRFSPQGNMLASGGDDCYVIIWKLNEDDTDGFSQLTSMVGGDVENKESWQVAKMLRGHIEDVYDLAWSPNATQLISGSVDNSVIIWDTNKGDKLRIIKDHRQYVQGVCWDPCGTYVASYSCDRTCRIYNTSSYRCCFNINKTTLPNKNKQENQSSKQVKIFHDETMPSFFRRLTFSPDGLLLFVPGGKFEVNEKAINTTFVFTKAALNKPVMYFPASKKPTIAVRCCPVLFELRNTDKSNSENKKPVFKLPYRMVIAIASLDSVVLYDTQRALPFGFLSNMHYASLTDIAWSKDGKVLAISSRDGYCSLVTFDANELGTPYRQTTGEVIENATVHKEISPSRKIVTPRSKTPDSIKDDRSISPKIEKLSIKNFVTVNPPKSNVKQVSNTIQTNRDQGSNQRTETLAPRRVGFVTLQPATERKIINQPQTSRPLITSPSNGIIPVATTAVSATTQPRRVNFTTLQLRPSLVANETTSNVHAPNLGASIHSQSTVAPASTQQPRRVSFTTLKPLQTVTTFASTSSSNSQVTRTNRGSNVESNQPRAVDSPLNSSIPPNPAHPPNTQPLPRRVGFVTVKPSQSSAIQQKSAPSNLTPTNQHVSNPLVPSQDGVKPSVDTTVTTVRKTLERQEKPPVPLEPEVIIIKD